VIARGASALLAAPETTAITEDITALMRQLSQDQGGRQ
jgi:hypothetical protein